MIECIQYYLKNGIVNYASVNLDEKRLMSEIGHDFYSWINDNMKFNERMILKDMFEKFCDQYPTYRKFSQKYTSGRIRKYGDYLVKKGKLTRVDAGKQNGSIPYIEYVTEQKKESEWDNLQTIDKAPF
jgi:hypothetical protein